MNRSNMSCLIRHLRALDAPLGHLRLYDEDTGLKCALGHAYELTTGKKLLSNATEGAYSVAARDFLGLEPNDVYGVNDREATRVPWPGRRWVYNTTREVADALADEFLVTV